MTTQAEHIADTGARPFVRRTLAALGRLLRWAAFLAAVALAMYGGMVFGRYAEAHAIYLACREAGWYVLPSDGDVPRGLTCEGHTLDEMREELGEEGFPIDEDGAKFALEPTGVAARRPTIKDS